MSAEETSDAETDHTVRDGRVDDGTDEPATPESTAREPAKDDTGHYAPKYPGPYTELPSRPRTPLPAAPVWLPLAVLGVGVLALFLATFDRPGIGLVITGVVAGLTAFTALMVRPAIPESADDEEGEDGEAPADNTEHEEDAGEEVEAAEEHERPDRYRHAWSAVYGILAVVLLATAALRDAGWVLAWTLIGAFFLASLAFAVHNPAARRNTVGVAAGSMALLRNALAVPVFLGRPLARLKASNRMFVPALVTAGVTAGLLVVFGALFAFADPIFAAHLENLFSAPEVNLGGLHPIAALFAVLFTGAAVLAARHHRKPSESLPQMFVEALPDSSEPSAPPQVPAPNQEEQEGQEQEPAHPWPVWVWTVPLGALAALFTVFLAVQATAMFGGDEYVQRVAGVIYAEYARQGFFQLVAVSLLVLGVVALVLRLVPDQPSGTRVLRNSMLGVLCFLTLIILASAMMRLQLYIDVFGLTRMRVAAEAWIAWSALLFGLILVAGVLNALGRRTQWLPRATVALGAVALAVFAYGNPDLRIAESHHDLDLEAVDTWYLRGLSADAVPGLIDLEGEDRTCALDRIGERLWTSDAFGARNLSRERARSLLAEHDLFGSVSFDGVDRSHCVTPYRY
ncbi:DUF4153 domain-containing protein [Nocardiopsis valliformis]|uniref:DUF4153 domain-containing protein n=1 Tax=Nocardiopsis valliformis TaxID=239974 RepID=UPI00034C0769|nr:DUF4173 domain-containing protein [Nocardiopsis valliformis]